jgi:hypothetical protein
MLQLIRDARPSRIPGSSAATSALRALPTLLALSALAAGPAAAGAGNPNLSVIAQPRLSLTNAADDPSRDRPVWDLGETEFVLDDYLNPYVRGTLVLAYAADEGLALEEGYVDVVRGLPGTLNLRLGQWRTGFGKLNPTHPHAHPFSEPFGVLRAFLPGDEGLIETGLEASLRLPSPGETSLVASADWLQGDSFRREREDSGLAGDPLAETGDDAGSPRPAALVRLSLYAPLDDRSGLELGLSGTEGTNNVAAATRTRVIGLDAKAKLWRGENAYLLLQAEALKLKREDAGWDGSGYTGQETAPWGWYAFADYSFSRRWNAGASYERYQADTADRAWNRSVGLFAGFALLEETTALRLDWRREQAGAPAGESAPDAVDVVTLRIIWSMGPHKAHQF